MKYILSMKVQMTTKKHLRLRDIVYTGDRHLLVTTLTLIQRGEWTIDLFREPSHSAPEPFKYVTVVFACHFDGTLTEDWEEMAREEWPSFEGACIGHEKLVEVLAHAPVA